MHNLAAKARSHHSLTWRGSLLLIGIASLEFFLPAQWGRWLLVVGFGVACFAVLVIDKANESPSVGAALGLCVVGALLFWFGAQAISPEAFFFGHPVSGEALPRTWLTFGAGVFIAGVIFGMWRLVVAAVKLIRRVW